MIKLKEWSDLDRTKSNIHYLENLFYYVFHPSDISKLKTTKFDKVIKQFNLTDTDLEQRNKIFKIYCILFIVITLGIWGYLIYSLIKARFLLSITIFCISLVPLSLVFRFHFYRQVIKTKKLDYSLKDWVKDLK